MNTGDDIREYTVCPGDVVALSRSQIEHARGVIPDVVDYLDGVADTFPAFAVPQYDGEQGLVQVDENRFEMTGFDGGVDESRLIAFAHLVRPFDWVDDPRVDQFVELISRVQNEGKPNDLSAWPAQELWDALFVHARMDRFSDGAVASAAAGLTRIANEIRTRLLSV